MSLSPVLTNTTYMPTSMNDNTQNHTNSNLFLVVSLMLVPALYFGGYTNNYIGPTIYVYFAFAFICYKALKNKPVFQMIKVFSLTPFVFCIIMTPLYFLNLLYKHGTIFENAFTLGHVFSAWFDQMLGIIAIGYLHLLAILMLFVVFYLFGGARHEGS